MAGAPEAAEARIVLIPLRCAGGHASMPVRASTHTVAMRISAMRKPGSTPATKSWPMETFMFTA